MSTATAASLTPAEKALSDAWDAHLHAEFAAHSADEAILTMVDRPRVLGTPLLGDGEGRDELHEFYAKYFVSDPAGYGGDARLADYRAGAARR